MQTIESLKAKISNVEDLHSVVKTMKAIAAVRIRQYEKAYASLAEYNRTVEMGLQIVIKQRYFAGKPLVPSSVIATKTNYARIGVLIFGSDQGLCGQFNEQIVSHALMWLDKQHLNLETSAIAAIGARLILPLEAAGYSTAEVFSVPTSATGITAMVQEILLTIEQWRDLQQINQIILFYNQPLSGASYCQVTLQLLPLDLDWLRRLGKQEWSTQVLPTFTMDEQQLLSALIRQYLFVSLYRAFAASLASENASRLAAMQSAQKNIEDRLSDLNAQYRRQRQSSITAELLDVVAGFEALS